MRKILITGCDGQVGHELRKTLAPLGNVIGVTRDTGDLTNPEVVKALLDRHAPDVIVNPAAYTAVDRAETDETAAFALNARAPEVMAQWAAAHGAVFVHYSTDYVYEGAGNLPQAENTATAPASVYGQTKLAGDQSVMRADPSALIFRTSWVYGARGHNFMLTMLRLARERKQLTVVGDQFGAPTPAWLIAQVTAIALAQRLSGDKDLQGLFHLTCRGEVSWFEFARAIIRKFAAHGEELALTEDQIIAITTQEYPAPAPRPGNSRLDVSRIEQALGIVLPDWESGLDVTLADMTRRP